MTQTQASSIMMASDLASGAIPSSVRAGERFSPLAEFFLEIHPPASKSLLLNFNASISNPPIILLTPLYAVLLFIFFYKPEAPFLSSTSGVH